MPRDRQMVLRMWSPYTKLASSRWLWGYSPRPSTATPSFSQAPYLGIGRRSYHRVESTRYYGLAFIHDTYCPISLYYYEIDLYHCERLITYLHRRARPPTTRCADKYAALQLLIDAVYDSMSKERLPEGEDVWCASRLKDHWSWIRTGLGRQ